LWVGTANSGLVRFDKRTGKYARFVNNQADPYSISSDHVLSMAADDSGILWLGTAEGGLDKVGPSSDQFTHYSISEGNSNDPTPNLYINAIVNDRDILWLATDRGLFKFNKNSGKSVFINDSQEIANTFVSGLLKDGSGNLWLSTSNGLIKYNIKSNAFKKYESNKGLQRNYYTTACFMSADNEMFFGGSNGFTCFYPDKIKENTHKPPIVITDIKIYNTSIRSTDTGKVSLTYKDDFISFEFAALDYANPSRNQYAYKLEGFDTDWHYNGTRNYLSYTNLDAGEYILRIRGSNNDGLWNEQGTQIPLVITPPFWETTWFLVVVIIFIYAAVILVIKMRTRSLKLKSIELEHQIAERTKELYRANEQLRQADEMKSNFLSMVSHEIRTPLSAILGFVELVAGKIEKTILPNINLEDKKVRKAAETINRDLTIILSEGDRLTTLVDNLLNISKIESGRVGQKGEMLDVLAVIEQALLIGKPMIEEAGLGIHLDIADDLPKISGDKDMLTQVFINLISNAVKSTGEGYIKISVKNSGGAILVAIEDTGAGIPEDHLQRIFEKYYKLEPSLAKNNKNNHLGLGLYICKQIIEQHGGMIWAESRLDKGSVFYFTIPHLQDKQPL